MDEFYNMMFYGVPPAVAAGVAFGLRPLCQYVLGPAAESWFFDADRELAKMRIETGRKASEAYCEILPHIIEQRRICLENLSDPESGRNMPQEEMMAYIDHSLPLHYPLQDEVVAPKVDEGKTK